MLSYIDINFHSHHIKQEKSLHYLFAALHFAMCGNKKLYNNLKDSLHLLSVDSHFSVTN